MWSTRKMVTVWSSVAIVVVTIVVVAAIIATHVQENIKTSRGRGDAPRTVDQHINGDPADFIVEMPDGWGNVATKCVYDGYRGFVTTKANGASSLVVVIDPRCAPKGDGPR